MSAGAASIGRLRAAWQRWTAPIPAAEPYSKKWWWDHTVIFTVFGVTGSSSVKFSGPILHNQLGLEGSFLEGNYYFVDFLIIL